MQKKNIIIISVAIVVSFLTGFFVGDATAINRVNSSFNVINPNINNSTNNNTTKEIKNYKFGEEGKSGNWNIKILDSKETNMIQGGSSSENKTTQQKFIVLKLQMTNIDTVPHQYGPIEFSLGNAKNKKQYKAAFSAAQAANAKETIYNNNGEFFGIYEDINPSTPKQTYVVFEVPKDFNIADGVLIHGTGEEDIAGYYIK